MTGKGFVDTVLPEAVRPYAHLARWDRPIGMWLLLLPGWWGLALASDGIAGRLLTGEILQLFLIFLVGAFLVRGAGCTVNDIWDRKIDGEVERTKKRPLPSGRVTVRQAVLFAAVQFLSAFLLLLLLNPLTILIGVLAVVPICLYPLLKRVTWWPQLGLGLVFNLSVLMGWTAVTGSLSWEVLLVYCGCICWTIGYDTVYAHQDMEDDARLGMKSTALLFGRDSKKFVAVFYAGAWVFWSVAVFFIFTHIWQMLLPALYLLWQILAWNPKDKKNSLKIFRSNQMLGWIILALFML